MIAVAKRAHWPAAASFLLTVLGALLSPAVLAVLPAKWAAVLTVSGAVAQALTNPLPRRPAGARTRRTDEIEVEP